MIYNQVLDVVVDSVTCFETSEHSEVRRDSMAKANYGSVAYQSSHVRSRQHVELKF